MPTLAVKYRPATFEEVVEQDVIKAILKNQIETKSIRNSYLFCGPAGTGKTTDARLFAKYINNNGNGIVELDAASHSGVEDVRKLIDDSKFKPIGCDYRVYIIDECFAKGTPVSTPNGFRNIETIKEGDTVYNITGSTKVKKVFRNTVHRDRLVCITTNKTKLFTTLDHLFFTSEGWIPASELKKGDRLVDYSELCDLWNRVPMLPKRSEQDVFQELCIYIKNSFKSKKSCNEEYKQELSDMWKGIQDVSIGEFHNLWNEMFSYLYKTTWFDGETKESLYEYSRRVCVSSMWEDFSRKKSKASKVLLERMCQDWDARRTEEQTKEINSIKSCLCYLWQVVLFKLSQPETDLFTGMSNKVNTKSHSAGSKGCLQSQNEDEQSKQESRDTCKGKTDEGSQRDLACILWDTWWEWEVHRATAKTISESNIRVDSRVSGTYQDGETFGISYELQARPCLTKIEAWGRGGWQQPFIEKATLIRCQENNTSGISWVEDIEIYKRGNNDKLFECCFKDTGSNSEYVTFYDLEVEGHNSYIASGVLVHNCHSLSNAAWQASLKVLEEPTPTSIFIFATTDPQKIPNTILSRVQRYDFKKISHSGITKRLKYILEMENKEGCSYTYNEDAISYIAKLADGGMRDAITLMEKVLGFSNDVTMESVVKALGTVDYNTLFDLTDALCKMDKKTVINIIETIYRDGMDLKQFIKNYNAFVLDLCKYDICRSFEFIQIPNLYDNRMSKYNNSDFKFFITLLNEMINLNNSIKWESTPKPMIESTFILLCSEA